MSVNILVYEHITAGGAPDGVPASIADAGRAMWRTLVDDMAGAGAKVWTTFGEFEYVEVNGQAIAKVTPVAELKSLIGQLAAKSDGAIVIAPETGGVLAGLIEMLSSLKVPVLNCSAKTIALCADKQSLCRHFEKHGVPTPPTRGGEAGVLLEGIAEALRFGDAGSAFVIKPRDGAGCEQTFVCRTPDEASSLRSRISGTNWVTQPYMPGTAVSASFIANGTRVVPLLAGSQRIEGDHELQYAGGMIPLDKSLSDRAFWLAGQAVKTLADLRGFIGVDLVLGSDARDDVVMEINPRVTMSYCALRQLCTTNLPRAMMDADAPIEWRAGRIVFDNKGVVKEAVQP